MLAENGYHCVNIGKMHTVPYDNKGGFHQRFIVENKNRNLERRIKKNKLAFYDEWDKYLANQVILRKIQ